MSGRVAASRNGALEHRRRDCSHSQRRQTEHRASFFPWPSVIAVTTSLPTSQSNSWSYALRPLQREVAGFGIPRITSTSAFRWSDHVRPRRRPPDPRLRSCNSSHAHQTDVPVHGIPPVTEQWAPSSRSSPAPRGGATRHLGLPHLPSRAMRPPAVSPLSPPIGPSRSGPRPRRGGAPRRGPPPAPVRSGTPVSVMAARRRGFQTPPLHDIYPLANTCQICKRLPEGPRIP
jgi:hypothetical protein